MSAPALGKASHDAASGDAHATICNRRSAWSLCSASPALISENRRAVNWKSAARRSLSPSSTAVLLLKVPQIKLAFALVNRAVDAISDATTAGTSFVFGYLGGGPPPFALTSPAPNSCSPSRRCRSCW